MTLGILLGVGLLGLYPGFVLGYTWYKVFHSDLEGGRHGPLDAYRHTLASAVVSYTSAEQVVFAVSAIMERNNKGPNRMDDHNNRIGALIGSQAEHFSDIEPLVQEYVHNGKVNATNMNQVTWLPEKRWKKSRLF
jgi:hypothetical protein